MKKRAGSLIPKGLLDKLARLNPRGQITLPKKLREQVGIPSDFTSLVLLTPNGKGHISLRVLGKPEEVLAEFERQARRSERQFKEGKYVEYRLGKFRRPRTAKKDGPK